VKVENIGCVLKAVEKCGVGVKGVRVSNRRGWMDKSKVYSQ
jgi:hypothetical protein